MVPKSKAEKKYLSIIPRFNKHIFMAEQTSPQEGFEYFESEEYKKKRQAGILL